MAPHEDEYKIQKFFGRANDDYNLWRIRAEMSLKGKDYWEELRKEDCSIKTKQKASAMLTTELGDSALRVCSTQITDPMKMLELLDKRYASTRTATRICVLTSVYSKRFEAKDNMPRYIDEFESLFSQLERMGKDAAIPESHKAPLLLASMGHYSPLESTVAALRIKDTEDITWEAVSADLIQEWKQVRSKSGSYQKAGKIDQINNTNSGTESQRKRTKKKGESAKSVKEDVECEFCGKKGHVEEDCFLNPESPGCRLPERARRNLLKAKKGRKSQKKNTKSIKFGMKVRVGTIRANSSRTLNKDPPVLDSGASTTMFRCKSEAMDKTYVEDSRESVTLAAGGKTVKCIGEGTVRIGAIELPNSLHVQQLHGTLVSVGQICDQSKLIIFTDKEAIIMKKKVFEIDPDDIELVVNRNSDTGLYELEDRDIQSRSSSHKALGAKEDELQLWHNRLVHANVSILRSLSQHVKEFPILHGNIPPCHPCLLGRATKKSFDSKFEDASYPGEIVYSDVCGKCPKSGSGLRYFVSFMDHYTRFIHVATLRRKSEVEYAFEKYKKEPFVLKHFPRGVQRLHSDGGGEYENVEVSEPSNTAPYTPQHNPFAERINRTLLDPVRILLEQSGLSAHYWDWAIYYVTYIKNRLPHSATNKSPYEMLTKKKPKLKYPRVFGCAAFVKEESPKSKVHARAVPGIFLGCNDYGVYSVMLLDSNKVVNSVHVTFDESSFPGLEKESSSSSGESNSSDQTSDSEDSDSPFSSCNSSDSVSGSIESSEERTENETKNDIENSDSSNEVTNKETESTSQSNRNNRSRKPPERYGFSKPLAKRVITVPLTTSDEPSVREAVHSTSPEAKLWKEAMIEELQNLDEKGTWISIGKIAKSSPKKIQGPNGEGILPTHFVLKIKRDEDGNPIRFKARIVAGGNHQVQGYDFDDVYSPVVQFTNLMLIQAVGMPKNWLPKHLDIKAAFLNGDIDRECYVSHPFNAPKDLQTNEYYLLKKTLYGLRQSAACWFIKLRYVMKNNLHYTQLKTDASIFKKSINDETVVAIVYVDDILVFCRNRKLLDESSNEILSCFEGTDHGALRWYLNVCVDISEKGCVYTQSAKIMSLVDDYKLANAKNVDTPMISNFYDEHQVHRDDKIIDETVYRKIIGSLLYISNRTRPDISAAVSILATFTSRPTEFLMKSARRVIVYLRDTANYGIHHSKLIQPKEVEVQFYADSDFGGEKEKRKSRTGWIGFCNGNPFTWASRKQTSGALSTAEAEYMAMSDCAREVKRVRSLLSELGIDVSNPITLYADNSAAREWANSVRNTRKAKHIEIQFHFIQECVERGVLKVLRVDSNNNAADIFTKPLSRELFIRHRNKLGLVPKN